MVRRILVVSDSHGRSQNIKAAIDKEFPDMLIHLGDLEDNPEMIREWLNEAAKDWNGSHRDSSDNKIGLPVPAIFIQGNCDRYYTGNGINDLKSSAVFELNGHRFYCTHGHKQGVSLGIENLMYTALENDCDIALFGHTHIPFDDSFDGYSDMSSGVRILNPGSITLPRGGSRKSYILILFEENGDYTVTFNKL